MEENEDIDGRIEYTDSQKSVTSNAYSQDFTDSSSDKNQSSGKETYVIDQMDIDSEKVYSLHSDESVFNLGSNDLAESEWGRKIKNDRKSRSESVFVENTYNEISKTTFEIRNKFSIQNSVEVQHFETQSSFVTITEKENANYYISINEENQDFNGNEKGTLDVSESDASKLKTLYSNSFDDTSSYMRASEIDCDSNGNNNFDNEKKFVAFKHYESIDVSTKYYDNTTDESTDEQSWNVNSDIEEDSLKRNVNYIESDTLASVENDVPRLYQTLENVPKASTNVFPNSVINDSVLKTITEETNIDNNILNLSRICSYSTNIESCKNPDRAARSKLRIQSLFNNSDTNKKEFKLPPIYTNSTCPNSPMINHLFSAHNQFQNHHVTSPSTIKEQQIILDPSSGERPVAYMNHGAKDQVQLPPISFNMFSKQYNVSETFFIKNRQRNKDQEMRFEEINIRDKIQDLKANHTKTESVKKRNNSPRERSFGEAKVCKVAEKGCDSLCTDIMRRLQSNTWQEITETLSYLPKSLESFWSIMSEMRIADLLRQLLNLIESPRTQVAREACEAAAVLLKHTNFTRKPDFYEAVGVLLAKTNSYNRVVRRAANLALDEIVCGLHYTHCIAAICIGGVEHKSSMVRCASSRLLIVCCALAEGGRRLLRCRPPSAAAARRHVLQAMAILLHDKNLETRKYAERLYAILRPLPCFEYYFLSDVEAELATEHMKKYDHLLDLKSNR